MQTMKASLSAGRPACSELSDASGTACDDRFRVLSSIFRVRTDSEDSSSLLNRLFGAMRADDEEVDVSYELAMDPGKATVHLETDGVPVLKHVSAADGFGYLTWHMMREAVARAGYVIVHAGVVARGDRAVVLPGHSGSGKSTLVAGLVRAGYDYLSDEMAAFDPATAQLIPVPRAMTIKRGSMNLFPGLEDGFGPGERQLLNGAIFVRAEDLDSTVVRGPRRLDAVVSPSYAPNVATELTPMSRAEAVSVLATNAFNLDAWGGRGIRVLAEAARAAECYRLAFGSLDEAVSTIRAIAG